MKNNRKRFRIFLVLNWGKDRKQIIPEIMVRCKNIMSKLD